jgi:hypothetical protein
MADLLQAVTECACKRALLSFNQHFPLIIAEETHPEKHLGWRVVMIHNPKI